MVASLSLLSGCGQTVTARPASTVNVAERHDSWSNLYVANFSRNDVTVYDLGKQKLSRKVTAGVSQPRALAFDSSGNLYVANSSTITEYEAGTETLISTISQDVSAPSALAFDASGNLYALNDDDSIEAPWTARNRPPVK
jgi:DNA-binding beta-propeller fold protein YncE